MRTSPWACLLVFSLAACGAEGKRTKNEPAVAAPTSTLTCARAIRTHAPGEEAGGIYLQFTGVNDLGFIQAQVQSLDLRETSTTSCSPRGVRLWLPGIGADQAERISKLFLDAARGKNPDAALQDRAVVAPR